MLTRGRRTAAPQEGCTVPSVEMYCSPRYPVISQSFSASESWPPSYCFRMERPPLGRSVLRTEWSFICRNVGMAVDGGANASTHLGTVLSRDSPTVLLCRWTLGMRCYM